MKLPLSIVADQQIANVANIFSTHGDVKLIDAHSISNNTVRDADILLVRSVTRVDEMLLNNTSVHFVGSATSGINHIDLNYLKRAGITFKYAHGSNARSVAEYVLSSLFVLAEQNGFSLQDQTIGIIGCGHIGSILKHFMRSLGINYFLNDPPRALFDNNENWLELDEVLCADIISLHVPLISDGDFPTLNLVNKRFLSKLKPNVIFINTSRGEVVDENELIKFKQAHPDAKLVLDVWRNEPNINISLLNHVAIPTPHIAGYSLDGKLKATKMLFDALCDYTDTVKNNVMENTDYGQHVLVLPETEDKLKFIILKSYDVRNDMIMFRNMANMSETKQGAYFHSLRKNYSIRREFDNITINTKYFDSKTLQQLQQLGFNL